MADVFLTLGYRCQNTDGFERKHGSLRLYYDNRLQRFSRLVTRKQGSLKLICRLLRRRGLQLRGNGVYPCSSLRIMMKNHLIVASSILRLILTMQRIGTMRRSRIVHVIV